MPGPPVLAETSVLSIFPEAVILLLAQKPCSQASSVASSVEILAHPEFLGLDPVS